MYIAQSNILQTEMSTILLKHVQGFKTASPCIVLMRRLTKASEGPKLCQQKAAFSDC